jgi:hypothetical protein
MTDHNDQFHMGRIPIIPYPYSKAVTAIESDSSTGDYEEQHALGVCREFIIDYPLDDSDEEKERATYDLYMVDPNDRKHLINISQLIRTMAPLGDANNLTVTIEGEEDAWDLKKVINYIYSRFVFPDTEKEDYTDLIDRIKANDPTFINTLLTDVNGDVVLPITTADNVYDKNGITLQTKLDSITRVGFASTFITATETGSSFSFNYPFENYRQDGNHIEVRIGGTIINKSRYYFVDGNPTDDGFIPVESQIVFTDHAIEKGRTISLLFIYNAASNGSTYNIMSGANIAAGSLPSTAFEKISDSFCYADPTSVASSKALYNLYVTLSAAISDGKLYSIFAFDSNTGNNTISVKTPDTFTLTEGCSISVLITTNKSIGYKLNVNGNTYTVNTTNGQTNKALSANQVIKFYYKPDSTYPDDVTKGKFYIRSMSDYRLSANRWSVITEDAETEISYDSLSIEGEDELFVYRNGVRLFAGLDYKDDRESKVITLFTRTEDQEKIVFEKLDVINA